MGYKIRVLSADGSVRVIHTNGEWYNRNVLDLKERLDSNEIVFFSVETDILETAMTKKRLFDVIWQHIEKTN